jgi:peptide/nickel transport system substrate-binding protein
LLDLAPLTVAPSFLVSLRGSSFTYPPTMRHLSAILLLSLALASCGGGDRAASGGEAGGTLVVTSAADAQTVLPPLVGDNVGAAVRDLVFDRLANINDDIVTIGDKGFTPRLADRWEWSPDSLSVAFHVNPRARWHDGQPVRADDVRFTYAVYADSKTGSPVTPILENVDSVTVRDSLTAVVHFKQRQPEAFYSFVYNIYVMPAHVYGSVPHDQLRTADVARRAVGSGRFRLARWDAGRRLELLSDTANYSGRAKLDRVIWAVTPDASASLAQLLSGQADMLEVVPLDQVSRIDSTGPYRATPYPSFQYAFMGLNNIDPKRRTQPHPIFGDRRVRRAISMALDRRAMLQNALGPNGKLSYGPFPRSLSFADTTLRLLPYDTTAARALLDSAGWRESTPGGMRTRNGQPLRFSLVVPVSSRARMAYAVLIQEQLRKVGAQVDVDQLQSNAMGQRQFSRTFDAILIAQTTDPSPSGYKQQWASAGAGEGGQNWVSFRNPTYDALVDSALATSDARRMRDLMRRAFQVQIDEAPAVWLYDPPTIAAVHRRFQIAPMRPDGWWVHLADWTVPPSARIDRDRVGLTTAAR